MMNSCLSTMCLILYLVTDDEQLFIYNMFDSISCYRWWTAVYLQCVWFYILLQMMNSCLSTMCLILYLVTDDEQLFIYNVFDSISCYRWWTAVYLQCVWFYILLQMMNSCLSTMCLILYLVTDDEQLFIYNVFDSISCYRWWTAVYLQCVWFYILLQMNSYMYFIRSLSNKFLKYNFMNFFALE